MNKLSSDKVPKTNISSISEMQDNVLESSNKNALDKNNKMEAKGDFASEFKSVIVNNIQHQEKLKQDEQENSVPILPNMTTEFHQEDRSYEEKEYDQQLPSSRCN